MDTSVTIIGGGPVGLITALGLAKSGIDVVVLEAEPGIANSPRAMSYAWPVLDGLELFGLLDDMKAEGILNHDRSWRVQRTGEAIIYDHSSLQDFVPRPYGLTLGQDRLAGVILRHLDKLPNVQVLWSTRFVSLEQDDHGVVAKAVQNGEELEVRSQWLIGTDGGRSGVRHAIGLTLGGFTWPERFVATNVRYDFASRGWKSGYVIDPELGAVVAQITDDGLWRVTFAERADLPAEDAERRIRSFIPRILPDEGDYELVQFSLYNMHQRSAESYHVGRVILAGDAAHITNPTSGFGLMGGMYDSFLLTETLAAVLAGDASASLIERYSEARRGVFHTTTSPISTESLRLVFHSNDQQRLDADLDGLRRRKDHLTQMREFLSIPKALETPSLLSGLTLQERLDNR